MSNAEQSGVTTVLLSYRRPELTKAAAMAILEWPGLERLVISIDGLRPSASSEEADWWKSTKRVAEAVRKTDSRVQVFQRPVNEGLTRHVIDTLSRCFTQCRSIIILEEDIGLTNQGFDFLKSQVHNFEGPRVACAFTRSQHRGEVPKSARLTHFPEQWGTSMNIEFFEEFLKLWQSKSLSMDKIEKSIAESLPGLSHERLRPVQRFWVRLFQSALNKDLSHQDALFSATAMHLNIPFRAPWVSFATDLGQSDKRGMNSRGRRASREFVHKPEIFGDGYCVQCEIKQARLFVASRPYEIYKKLYGLIRGKNFKKGE